PHEPIEEADGNCSHPGSLQLAGGEPHGPLIDGRFDPAIVPDPLWYLQPQLAGDERSSFVGLHVVEGGTLLPPDLEEVAKAGACDEACEGAMMLYEGVGRNCGAVAEIADVPGNQLDATH